VTANGGSLKILVIEANLTRNTETFGKMDPFVEIKTSNLTKKTAVKDEAGAMPIWNEMIELVLDKIENKIEFTVLEEDTTTNDTVGSVSIDMISFCTKEPL
jgi:Ca2+-dependent lipid-binding protein